MLLICHILYVAFIVCQCAVLVKPFKIANISLKTILKKIYKRDVGLQELSPGCRKSDLLFNMFAIHIMNFISMHVIKDNDPDPEISPSDLGLN